MAEEAKKQTQETKETQKPQETEDKKETKQESKKKEEFDVKETKDFQNMERLKTKWHNRAKELEEENKKLQERNTDLENDLEAYIEELSNLQQAMDHHRKRADRTNDTINYALRTLQNTINNTINTLNIIDEKTKEE